MAQMTKEELVTLLRQEITQSEGFDSDNLASNRKLAYDYYLGRRRGDEITGRSSVQSLDVADMCEAVMSELMPTIETDDLAVFMPVDSSDIEQAALESDAVNNMIMGQNDGYMVFETSFLDALLMRNGWAKVWIDENVETQTHSFEAIDPIAAVQLTESEDPSVEIEIVSQADNEDNAELVDITLRITTTSKRLKVGATDPTLMLFQENHDSLDLDGIRFVAERDFPTRTELINDGFDKGIVNALKAITLDTKNDSEARNRSEGSEGLIANETSMDAVERYRCYYLVDFDGDSVAELREVHIVEATILFNEPADFRPYATGSPFPQPHRLNGLSLFDKLKEVQDVKTCALRNWLDNQTAVNRPGLVVGELVDLDQVMDARINRIIVAPVPAQDVLPIPITDISASTVALMDYMDKARSERGGASLDLLSAEAQIAGDTAHGIERQYSAREKLAGRMARNLAKTLVKNIFLLVHETMRLHLRAPITISRGGQFEQVNPSEWRAREHVIVKTGMTLAERNQRMNALGAIYSQQKELIQIGQEGILTTLEQGHNTLMDMVRAAGIDNPERYWTSPVSEEAQQRQQQNQQAEQAQQAAQQAQTQQVIDAQLEVENIKSRTDRFEAKLDAVIDLVKILSEQEQTEVKVVGDAVTQLAAVSRGAGNAEE